MYLGEVSVWNHRFRSLARPLAGALCGLGLMACASTAKLNQQVQQVVSGQKAKLDASPTCCEKYSDMTYVELSQSMQRFAISEGPARQFSEGKSYFLAIDLPSALGAPYLLIESNTVLWRRHGLPYIFKPSVIALDDNHDLSGRWVDLPLCYQQGWGHDKTGYFSAVKIDPLKHSKLVFYTSESALSESTRYENSATTAGGGLIVTINTQYDFPHSPLGDITIGPMSSAMETYLRKGCPGLFEGRL